MWRASRFASITVAASISASAMLSASPAAGQTILPTAPGDRVRYDLTLDLSATLLVSSIWAGTQLLQPILAQKDCRWCDRHDDGSDALNALDKAGRGLRWSNTEAANTVSNVLGYAIDPAAALGAVAIAAGVEGRLDETAANALLIMEASCSAAMLTQLVKFAVGRERPFVHYLSAREKGRTTKPSDNNVSFFSAHSNFAFALATSSGTIAWLRGYRYAPAVFATTLPIAATIAYLRVAADRHYLTDVLTGAVVGTAAGFAIPFLFHRGEPAKGEKTGLAPASFSASGSSFSMTWQW
jgi:membrane-associated phospholipid phosphatase